LVWWLPLMLLAGAQEQEQQQAGEAGCSGSAKTCGNLTIANPFWLRETMTTTEDPSSSSCVSVSPDFEVTCLSNDTPALPSSLPSSLGFAITDIFYAQASLRVVDLGKIRLSQASNGCGIQIWNTSDKLARPFRIGLANVNLVLYNCTDASAARRDDGELVETRLGCGNETQVFVRVEEEDDETRAIEGCDAVVLPVLGGANGKPNASDYERLIADGFLMTWDNTTTTPLGRKLTHPNHLLVKFIR